MFDITPTEEIKISRGDASGSFSLDVNLGTELKPLLFKFYKAFDVVFCSNSLHVNLDKKQFKLWATEDKTYRFEYNYKYNSLGEKIDQLGWYVDGDLIDLTAIGITVDGIPNIGDMILINYFIHHISEVYFNVFNIHSAPENFIFQKIFRNDEKVITNINYGDGYSHIKYKKGLISKGLLLAELDAEDTENLRVGEYRYQIKVKLYDPIKQSYIINTINHPTAFYIMS